MSNILRFSRGGNINSCTRSCQNLIAGQSFVFHKKDGGKSGICLIQDLRPCPKIGRPASEATLLKIDNEYVMEML